MMAMTTVSAWPATDAEGTICVCLVWKRAGNSPASRAGRIPVDRLVQG